MRERYQLAALGNDELLAALSRLVRTDNELASDLLAHLAELDQRRLYLQLGYPSMFAYCTDALGLCRSSAYRRIAAARACRQFPELFERVANGDLTVSALSEISTHVNAENAAELFEACARKSCRQVEELLAARFPKADVKEQFRRLPLEPLSGERFGVHFTADTEFRDLLQEVRDLASYRQPNGDLMILLKAGLKAYRRELEKARFGLGRKPRVANQTDAVPASGRAVATRSCRKRSRYVPMAVRREAYLRDGQQCTFVAEDGRRCAARAWLERDHIEPVACGGASSVENIRMRCRAHNLEAARQHFGHAYVQAAMAHAGARHTHTRVRDEAGASGTR